MPKINHNKVFDYDCRFVDCKELEIDLKDYSWNVRLCDVERAYKLVSTVWAPQILMLKRRKYSHKEIG